MHRLVISLTGNYINTEEHSGGHGLGSPLAEIQLDFKDNVQVVPS